MTQWSFRERLQLNQSVTNLAFDGHQDLLWTGSAQGQISSFLYPGNAAFMRYSSFPFNFKSSPPLQILPLEHAVYSVGFENVKCTNKRGVVIWNKLFKNGTSICTSSMHSELVVASNEGKLVLINLTRGSVLKEIEVDNGIIALKHGRYICSASSTGHVSFRDPVTYKEEHSMNCHTGGVSSMDISGNYLITTGYSVRGTSLIPDPMIKVYDIRINKFLPPVPCSAGPTFARFHPNYSASILAGSREGLL
jgi:PAB-dependent poly(A)-specific ribonuclease subunit 2